jgi:hypothetical protein
MVDDDLYEGVQTNVDRRFAAAAFYLPEGRLDVGIERLGAAEHFRDLDHLRIVRSRDLDLVDWDDDSKTTRTTDCCVQAADTHTGSGRIAKILT